MKDSGVGSPTRVVKTRRWRWLVVAVVVGGSATILGVLPATYLPARGTWGVVILTVLAVVLVIRRRRATTLKARFWKLGGFALTVWLWVCLFLGVTGWDARFTRAPSNDVIEWAKHSAHRIPRLDTYDRRDWEFLRDAIASRRIVMIGESNHCVEEYSQAKFCISRFLHEELGFNVLAFESYMLPAHQANLDLEAGGSAESAASSIYPMWNTVTVRRLFSYIRATKPSDTPMHVAGFDMKIRRGLQSQEMAFVYGVLGGDSALAGRYSRALARFGPDICERFARGDIKSNDPLAAQFADFFNALPAELDRSHSRGPMTEASATDVGLGAQIARNLAAQPAYNDAKPLERVALRDSLMAINIEYLAEKQYPGEKIIVWAHNGHIARGWSEAVVSDVPYMFVQWLTNRLSRIRWTGEYVSDRYGDDVYVLGLHMTSGLYKTIGGDERRVRPSRRDSVEYLVRDATVSASFLDFTRTTDAVGREWQSSASRILFEDQWYRIIPERQYDGVLVVSRATPPVK